MSVNKQNQFVIISSLILHHTAEQFPLGLPLNATNLFLAAKKHGIETIINDSKEIIAPTIQWLADEKYIRGPVGEDELFTITEKGLISCDHKFPKAPQQTFEPFTTVEGDEYFFKIDGGYNKEVKLKCSSPAFKFLPDDWFQDDE